MSIKFAKTVVPAYATPENEIKHKSKRKGGAASRAAGQPAGSRKSSRKDEEDKKTAEELLLEDLIEQSARYLVIHNGRLLASFGSEDDALLFEGELADIERAQGVQSALCEVRDRKGRRIGGYLITAGRLCAFLRDPHFNQRFGRTRRRS